MKFKNGFSRVGPILFTVACLILSPLYASGVIYDITVDGTDAIYLAGRDDVTVPDSTYLFNTWVDGEGDLVLMRHGSWPPDFEPETFPKLIPVTGGDVVRVYDPAEGAVDFYPFPSAWYFGPEGYSGGLASNLWALEGLSGWYGPRGPLSGVFLDDTNPNEQSPPATLDFWTAGTRDFTTLSPLLSQVFFIGDGVNSGGDYQEFVAPATATRLFLGIPDGFDFQNEPGAYNDNDGQYRIIVGVNEVPFLPVPIDIKPGSCPNPINTKSGGVVSVAITGTEVLDVTTIDPTTVTLAGVLPLRWDYEDVATPYAAYLAEDCYDCHELEGDGFEDIVFKFNKRELVAALGPVNDGDCLVVTLNGTFFEEFGGADIGGTDVVLIIKK